jgi:signal transduction histidine kinase
LAALTVACAVTGACRGSARVGAPHVEIDDVPRASEGGPETDGHIAGRAVGARPGQRIVLYAKSGLWYIQPNVDDPFTDLMPDASWANRTHLGTDYAALLVEPGFSPPATVAEIPAAEGGVVAVAATAGAPPFWQTWKFGVSAVLALVLACAALYRARMRSVKRRLNVRFEERLAERTRVAQELHDTLLQGVVSASMQLHVGLALLPQDSPATAMIGRAAELMARVAEEGRVALRGLGAPDEVASLDLGEALARAGREIAADRSSDVRVVVDGRPRALHPLIRDEIFAIARRTLVDAFRSGADRVEVRVRFGARRLRVLIRRDGPGAPADGNPTKVDVPDALRERAERIGARLARSGPRAGRREVTLTVPGYTAYREGSSNRAARRLARLLPVGARGASRGAAPEEDT